MNSESPCIGVGVIIVRQGLVLLGQRKGSHGSGSWAVPGGHLEFGETVENCARRETLEETGILLGNIALGPFTNNVFELERKHYVTLFVTSNSFDGEPKALEPEKCSRGFGVRGRVYPLLYLNLWKTCEAGYVPAA
jgi:8-oxo-dGTP diphosphatase